MVVPNHLLGNPRWTKRWGLAASASSGVCALCFVYLSRDGCWLHLARGYALSTVGFELEQVPPIHPRTRKRGWNRRTVL